MALGRNPANTSTGHLTENQAEMNNEHDCDEIETRHHVCVCVEGGGGGGNHGDDGDVILRLVSS